MDRSVEPRSTVLEVEKRRKGVDIVAEEKEKVEERMACVM